MDRESSQYIGSTKQPPTFRLTKGLNHHGLRGVGTGAAAGVPRCPALKISRRTKRGELTDFFTSENWIPQIT